MMKFINACRPVLLVRFLSRGWVGFNGWLDRLEGCEVTKSVSGLKIAKAFPLEGVIDEVNKEFILPEMEGEVLVTMGGQILDPHSNFKVEEGKLILMASPDDECQRPTLYFVKFNK